MSVCTLGPWQFVSKVSSLKKGHSQILVERSHVTAQKFSSLDGPQLLCLFGEDLSVAGFRVKGIRPYQRGCLSSSHCSSWLLFYSSNRQLKYLPFKVHGFLQDNNLEGLKDRLEKSSNSALNRGICGNIIRTTESRLGTEVSICRASSTGRLGYEEAKKSLLASFSKEVLQGTLSDGRVQTRNTALSENVDASKDAKDLLFDVNSVESKLTDQDTISCDYDEDDSDSEDGWLRLGKDQVKLFVESPGGRTVVELVSAWDSLSGRLAPEFIESCTSQLLLGALKLTIPALQNLPFGEDGRLQLSRALEIAYTLADLQMDPMAIAAGILQVAVQLGCINMATVEKHLGSEVIHLLHDCIRVQQLPMRMDTLDDENASLLRRFSLAFHDVRAVVVELAARLDRMRHIDKLPKYRQQIMALETMQIYAPLAHALGIGNLSLELEDIAFGVLFPDSYQYVESWLNSRWGDGDKIIEDCRQKLLQALEEDDELQDLVESITVLGRCKSRFSTMKKLLRDGRRPEEVYDILGLRVVLLPKSSSEEKGVRACYRAFDIVSRLWNQVPGRFKDYVANPKQNGYQSLHLAVHLNSDDHWNPPVELQIRTAAMDAHAVGGAAAHALYKGGLTDPDQVRYLKAIMVAAANVAASKFRDLTGIEPALQTEYANQSRDQMFIMFDKNKDGVISMEEFQDVIRELGVDKNDAHEIMQIVDANTNGTVSAKEFREFCQQVNVLRNMEGVDRQCSAQLGWRSQDDVCPNLASEMYMDTLAVN